MKIIEIFDRDGKTAYFLEGAEYRMLSKDATVDVLFDSGCDIDEGMTDAEIGETVLESWLSEFAETADWPIAAVVVRRPLKEDFDLMRG